MVLPWRRQNNWRTKRQSLREWVLWSQFFSQAFLFAGIYLKFCFSIPVLIFQIPTLRHQETGKAWAFGQSCHVVAWMQTNITFVCQRFSVLRFVLGKHRQSQLCHSKGSNRPPVGLCMSIGWSLIFACLFQGIRFGRGNLQRGSRDLEADTPGRNGRNYIVELLKHLEKLKGNGVLRELSHHLECLFWTSWPLYCQNLPTS